MDVNSRILATKLLERMRAESLKEGGTIGEDGVPLIKTTCPECRASLPTPYIELYALKRCLHCGQQVVPSSPVGTKMYMPPWGMSYGSFCGCLKNRDYWNAVGPLLRNWYDYDFEVIGGIIKITDYAGQFVDSLKLHLEIQADEGRQYAIYQAYMNIAR
jgi:hypothetical protein